MARKYHTLVSNSDGEIRVEYGSYDKQDCRDEIDTMVDDFGSNWKRKDFKIITTPDAKKKTVDAAVAEYRRKTLGESANEFHARRAKEA